MKFPIVLLKRHTFESLLYTITNREEDIEQLKERNSYLVNQLARIGVKNETIKRQQVELKVIKKQGKKHGRK